MIEPAHCYHERLTPVVSNDDVTVAQICQDCDAQLDAGFGCPICRWDTDEHRVLGDPLPVVDHILVSPCPRHA